MRPAPSEIARTGSHTGLQQWSRLYSKSIGDFFSLHTRSADPSAMNVWAFDLLMLNGRDLREQSLEKRKARLHELMERFDCPGVLMSQTFADGQALLRAAEEHRLEGVVSKRRAAPYRSGPSRDWQKIKTQAWLAANRERWRLFEPRSRPRQVRD